MTDTSTKHSEGVWDRLRRRKLVQWSIAYVAGAWGLLQGIAYIRDTFAWPPYVQQAATVLLLIGLPIVLVLAWYHGDRGHRQVTRSELAILTMLFLLGGAIFWYFQRTSEVATSTVASPASPSAAAFATDASIAVLPFVNMSADKEQEYFADGVSEELLNLLAQVPELRVIARTSSFSFKGKEVDITEISRKLNVANVLEGSVRKSGDMVRITAQLVRASDSSHLWSKTYDRQMTDVFKVQDEIASTVVSELKIKLLGPAPTAQITDPKAYALFLQARQISRQYTAPALQRSIELYKEALAIDPSYALAWDGLAAIYESQVESDLRLPSEGIPLARDALAKALAIQPRLASAHASLGWIALFHDRDLAAAARHLEYALALEPANPDNLGVAAILARRLGRLEQAIAIGEYLVARDPANSFLHTDLGFAYRYAGRLDAAIGECRTVLSLSPGYMWSHRTIGDILLQQGDTKAALAEMQQEPDEQARLTGLSMAYHALGRENESDASLAHAIEKYEKTSAHPIAVALAFRGETDRAFGWLEKAVQYNDTDLGATALQPMFAPLHSDPRWLPLLRKIGMAPEQLAAIKFDVKVPD